MNLRLFFLGLLAGIVFLNSCNDDLNNVGLTTRPDGDGNSIQADTFYIELSTHEFEDGVYARSLSTSLGQMYDPLYGNTKADYLFQVYCEEDFTFKKTPVNKVDSVVLRLIYRTWEGDEISPMTAQVYEVSNPLDRNFYSEFDPKQYYTPDDFLGAKTYTPRDYSISDSLWNVIQSNLNGQNSNQRSYYYIDIPLNESLGQKIYDHTQSNPKDFSNQDAFNQFFKGLYVTTSDNSSGNMLNVLGTMVYIYYDATTPSKVTGKDSVYVENEVFIPTQEVIQRNHFKHTRMEENQDRENYAYIKSMGGLYTKATIPTASENLLEKIEGRTINNLNFSIKVTPKEEHEYALKDSIYLLLLPIDSVKPHFEKNRLIDNNVLAYSATPGNGRIYNFGNIANIVTRHMENEANKDKDIELAIIPIAVTVDANYGTTIIDVQPLLTLAGNQIRKDDDLLKFYITSSKFNELE